MTGIPSNYEVIKIGSESKYNAVDDNGSNITVKTTVERIGKEGSGCPREAIEEFIEDSIHFDDIHEQRKLEYCNPNIVATSNKPETLISDNPEIFI